MRFKNPFRKADKEKEVDPLLTKKHYSSHQKDVETLKAGVLAKRAIEVAGQIIDTFGPRPTGSESCLLAADTLEKSFATYCDFTAHQDFNHHGRAYTAWLSFIPFVYLVDLILLLFGLPITALLVYGFFIYAVIREFILYKPIPFIEKQFKSKKGRNVHGVIEPEGVVKHTIMFSSHHDSAHISSFNKEGKRAYFTKVALPFGLFAISGLVTVVQLIVEIGSGRIIGIGLPPVTSVVFLIILLLCFPFLLPLKKFMKDEASVGAGDNLIAATMSVELSRYFKWQAHNGKALQHTRLIFASFDCEEEGLRGSRAWFDKNSSLIEDGIQLNFDCLYDANKFMFINSDINGTQPLSVSMASKCMSLTESMGYSVKSGPLPMFCGGTDAAEGFRAGLQACSLMAVSFSGNDPQYYHTDEDTIDKIDEKAVEKAISLSIKLCHTVDNERFEEKEILLDREEEEAENPEINFSKLTKKN